MEEKIELLTKISDIMSKYNDLLDDIIATLRVVVNKYPDDPDMLKATQMIKRMLRL